MAGDAGPPALCLVLIQRGATNATSALQSRPHYFSSLNVTSPSAAPAAASAAAAAAAPATVSASQRQRQAGLNAALSSAAAAAAGKAPVGGQGVPAFTATTVGRELDAAKGEPDDGQQPSSWCRLSVDAERLVLEARFPGQLACCRPCYSSCRGVALPGTRAAGLQGSSTPCLAPPACLPACEQARCGCGW